ncbi:hypothetical protein AB0G79_24255 [Streptomyces sp. NPDC020807]|uniref:hypothetical protein n=1 Tax=Streptomyces sp. NPDC020807 TaxID=3155119 RepID=UPI00340AE566
MSILAAVSLEDTAQTKAVLPAWVRAGFPLHEEPYLAHMFSGFIEAGQRLGDISPDVDAALAGNLLRDVYLGTLYRWTQAPDGEADLEADQKTACSTLLDGLLPRCSSTK